MESDAAASRCTRESLWQGELFIAQHQEGYRYSIDAVLLAAFCAPKKNDTVAELGAGSGIVSLLLARRHPAIRLAALEIQPRLAELGRRNVAMNGLGERIDVREGDLRRIKDIFVAGSFSMALSNPPYYEPARGRVSADPEAAVARHADCATIVEVAAAMAWCLKTGGRAVLVYPAAALATLFAAMRQHRLEPKRLRPVYAYPAAGAAGRARLVLVEAVRNGGPGLDLLPPLYVHDRKNGDYSAEVARMFEAPSP